jgi:tRNA threonylcarbamoyladenosine biosynthesis protein TsaB
VSYILNIDTAVIAASVCLAHNDQPLNEKLNPSQKDHAAWLHLAIHELMQEAGIALHQLDAIAISAGPGSYTGLRVGMSTAKGLCYALQKPLITINTLQMMASAALADTTGWVCPMIDARRMEVFTAIYDDSLKEVLPPVNMILDEHSFEALLSHHYITFFGNGSPKFQNISHIENARFKNIEAHAKHMTGLAFNKLSHQEFADLAYSEPFYGKDFYLPTATPTV